MLGTSRPLAAHTFAACARVCPEVIWAALTDPDQTAAFLYGLAAHSTWLPGAPIAFRHGSGAALTGRVLHARRHERLSYLLQAGPDDPPVYLTWLLRPTQADARSGWKSTNPTAPAQLRPQKMSGCPSSPRCRIWSILADPARRGDRRPGTSAG